MPKLSIASIALLFSGFVATASAVEVTGCLTTLIDEVQLPAEEAGVLTEMSAVRGQQVKAGDIVARIDDTHTKMQRRVADLRFQVATAQANNNTNVEYATAASKVALADYNRALEANRKMDRAVPEAEVQRLKLTFDRTSWEIKQALVNKNIASLEAAVSQAEVEAADENLDRRVIKSPLDGEVVQLHRHRGEWVKPGDPVVHIVRLNELYVDGFLSVRDYMPGDVLNKPVVVEVELSKGRVERFAGKIASVQSMVRAGNEYQISARVANRRDERGGNWMLLPGMVAKMTIQVD